MILRVEDSAISVGNHPLVKTDIQLYLIRDTKKEIQGYKLAEISCFSFSQQEILG